MSRVELLADVPPEQPEDLLDLVTLVPGAPYDDTEARRSLRNLEASGVAAEAELWTRPGEAPGTVVVMVAVWANVRVGEVALLGEDLALKRDTLLREVEVKRSQPLLEDRVLRSVYRLEDRYRAEGYFDATVRARVSVDEADKRARVAFALTPGARARIGTLRFEGDLAPLQPTQLVSHLQAGLDQPYRQSTVRDDAERLRRWLHDQGYRQAEVELLAERYDPARQRVDLDYRVVTGPKLIFSVEGADLDQLRKKGLLPFLGDEGYDEAVVLQAMQRIRRFYQERGHYRVTVDRREVKDGGAADQPRLVHLTLVVDPGPVYTLREVRFVGNEGVPASQLRELMTTSERRLLVAGSGRLVDEVLASDVENVRAFYAISGWAQAKVGPAEVAEEGNELILTLPVVEGKRTRVVNLELEGVAAIDPATVRAQLPLQPGGPYHARLLDESLDRVRSLYEQQGYALAQVSASTEWDSSHTLVDVTFRVLEGPQQLAGTLIVRGNQRTKTGVVKLLAGLDSGEPLSRRRLLEIQRGLYRLGIFSRVEVELAAASETLRQRDVVVEVEEARNRRVGYGFGYDSEEGIGGLFSYSHANLFGRALHLQLDLRASNRTQRYRLLLNQPYWSGDWPGSLNYLIYSDEEHRSTFHVEQRGAQAELVRSKGRLRFSLLGDYRQVDLGPGDETLDLSDLTPEEQRAFQDIEILSVVPRVMWDGRDDPIDPHAGRQALAQMEYAFPVPNVSQENFLQLFGQLVQYWNLRRLGVVAVSLRMGGIEQLGDQPVSVAERFFAGGRTTHRAYERDQLGIPDETLKDGDPIGGLGLLLLNVDYRFPIYGALGGTLFVDSGNVWERWQDIDPQEAKTGVGIGLRYMSPIGPLRLEVGFKLDREPDESDSVVLISFGNAF